MNHTINKYPKDILKFKDILIEVEIIEVNIDRNNYPT